MHIVRIALGVIRNRGADVIVPSLVVFGPTEVDFLVRHIDKVRRTGLSGRSTFVDGAHISTTLTAMQASSDTDFAAGAEALQQALARTMGTSTNASDCVFAVIHARPRPGDQASHITVLKLDAIVEAARVRINQGVVNLQVLRELVPEPGALRKAMSWPDPRPDSDVLMIDTNASNAQYFEDAYQVRVSPKSPQAEAELQAAIVNNVPKLDLPRALAAAAALEGPSSTVLAALAADYPSLVPAAQEMAADPRPAGIIRPNRVAARPVVWRADGVELRVPADRAADVEATRDGDGWTLSIKVQTEPVQGV